MVAGGVPASMAAAVDGDARWQRGLEWEEKGEEVPEDGVLTLVVRARSVKPEGDGRRRLSPLPRRSEAGGMRTATAVQGSTARFRRREERGGCGEASSAVGSAPGGRDRKSVV